MGRPISFITMLLIPLFALLFGSVESTPRPKHKACGWELMQNFHIPISHLGDWYAAQTGDRSLCTPQDDGSEYCTCIYECGNGVWSYRGDDSGDLKHQEWTWEKGCKKYCHAAVCDGQDPRD